MCTGPDSVSFSDAMAPVQEPLGLQSGAWLKSNTPTPASNLAQCSLGSAPDAIAGNTQLHCIRRNTKVRIKGGWHG